MKQVAATHHLIRRSAVWYFCRKVPAHLVERARTPVVKYSLKTTDKAEAKRLCWVEDGKFDLWVRELEEARGSFSDGECKPSSKSVTADQLKDYVRDFIAEEDARRKDHRLDPPRDPKSALTKEEVIEELQIERNTLREAMEDDVGNQYGEMWISHALDKISKRAGTEIGRPVPSGLYDLVGRGLQEIARRQESRWTKGYAPAFFDPDFAPLPAGAKPKVGGVTFRQLSATYVAFKRGGKWADTTEVDMAYVLRVVYEVIDPETPAKAITTEHVREVRDRFASLRVRAGRVKEGGTAPVIAGNTQIKYFSMFKSILSWGADEGYLDTVPGPGIKIAPPKSEAKSSPAFSGDELNAIFSTPLFVGCAGVDRRDEPGEHVIRDGFWWVPLIGLFTGMRLGEIVQLLTSDVKAEGGIRFLDVAKVDGDEKRIKTAPSVRRVPIPQVLFDLGFEAVLAQADPTDRLFPEIELKAGKAPSEKYSEWWSDYTEEVGVKSRRMMFHAFRHTFIDATRDAEVPDFISCRLTGHASKSGTHGKYGAGASLSTLKANIDKVVFPTVDLAKFGMKA